MNPPACVECKFYRSAGLPSPACDHPDHQPPDSYDIVTGKENNFWYRCDWMRRDGKDQYSLNQSRGPCGPEGALYQPNLWARIKIAINDWLTPF